MNIRNLQGVSSRQILDAFNSAFSKYIVPLQLNIGQLEFKMRMEKVNPEYSVGVFEDKRLVGFILHAVDDVNKRKVVYNAGTGVIPEMRGKSLTRKMYDYVLPVLKGHGVDHTVLEVITKNENAIRIYEQCGFSKIRELDCYRGMLIEKTISSPAQVRKLDHPDWKEMESFTDFEPTWQNSRHVLESLKSDLITLGAFIGDKAVGFLLYLPASKRLSQIAVKKDFRRRGIGTMLLQSVRKEFDPQLTVINVDTNSSESNAFMQSTGLEMLVGQYEMGREL